jgi:hypothetical protein
MLIGRVSRTQFPEMLPAELPGIRLGFFVFILFDLQTMGNAAPGGAASNPLDPRNLAVRNGVEVPVAQAQQEMEAIVDMYTR